jgi:hypothetical protein
MAPHTGSVDVAARTDSRHGGIRFDVPIAIFNRSNHDRSDPARLTGLEAARSREIICATADRDDAEF